jgi:hypothetical protein
MNENIKLGFTYTVDVFNPVTGEASQAETIKNIMPHEGMAHVLNTILKSGSQVAQWYVGIYEGAYTPLIVDTLATFPGSATESTAYGEATRVAYAPGTVAAGAVDNVASKAEFTMNAIKSIYGGFITSAPAKNGTSGTLLSAVRFATAKQVDVGSVLRVTAGFQLTSA